MTTILLFASLGYGAGRLAKLSRPIAMVMACFASLLGLAVAGAQGQLAPPKADCPFIESHQSRSTLPR